MTIIVCTDIWHSVYRKGYFSYRIKGHDALGSLSDTYDIEGHPQITSFHPVSALEAQRLELTRSASVFEYHFSPISDNVH